MTSFFLHGEVLSANLPLHLLPGLGQPTISIAPHVIGSFGPSPMGTLMFETDQLSISRRCEQDHLIDSYVLDIRSLFSFEIENAIGSHVTIRPTTSESQPVELLSGLLCGSIFSALMTLRGHQVLHANTVAIDQDGFAVCGHSGQGKSVTSALLLAAGGQLITDDVTIPRGADRTIYPGSFELRLRAECAHLATAFETKEIRSTIDQRIAVLQKTPPSKEGVKLNACILPRPTDNITRPRLTRLKPADALAQLLTCQRLIGWKSQTILNQEFVALAELVNQIPVVAIEIPKDLSNPKALGSEIVDLLMGLTG